MSFVKTRNEINSVISSILSGNRKVKVLSTFDVV